MHGWKCRTGKCRAKTTHVENAEPTWHFLENVVYVNSSWMNADQTPYSWCRPVEFEEAASQKSTEYLCGSIWTCKSNTRRQNKVDVKERWSCDVFQNFGDFVTHHLLLLLNFLVRDFTGWHVCAFVAIMLSYCINQWLLECACTWK